MNKKTVLIAAAGIGAITAIAVSKTYCGKHESKSFEEKMHKFGDKAINEVCFAIDDVASIASYAAEKTADYAKKTVDIVEDAYMQVLWLYISIASNPFKEHGKEKKEKDSLFDNLPDASDMLKYCHFGNPFCDNKHFAQ